MIATEMAHYDRADDEEKHPRPVLRIPLGSGDTGHQKNKKGSYEGCKLTGH